MAAVASAYAPAFVGARAQVQLPRAPAPAASAPGARAGRARLLRAGRRRSDSCPVAAAARVRRGERSRRRAPTWAVAPSDAEDAASEEVERTLERIRSALGLPSGSTLAGTQAIAPSTPFACAEGDGTYMGLHSRWRLQVRHDGAFHSETVTVGQGLHYQQGYEGPKPVGAGGTDARVAAAAAAAVADERGAADVVAAEGDEEAASVSGADLGTAWTVENDLASLMELDDREDALLSMWMRSGAWLLPHVRPRLVIDVKSGEGAGGDDAGDADGKPRVPDGVAHAVHVRIRGGKVCARLLLGEDCIPLQLRMQMWGSEEVYELSDWRSPSDGGAMFPARVAHYPASGGTDTYVATRAGAAAVSDALFVAPDVHARAADTTYIENMSPLVQARRTPGGHILVRALLNGCDCGEWLLDTGCSGLVVSKATADKLRMETFGKLSITSVGGSHQSQMRRCATLQIGPVVMANPLFLEIHDAIDVVDSAQGSNAPAGIIGWDFFRRAAVELPAAGKASDVTLRVMPPDDPSLSVGGDDESSLPPPQPLHLVGRVPHVEATVSTCGISSKTLFMLDSGARGTDLIFHSSSPSGLQMLEALGERTSRMVVRGLTKAARVQARSGVVDRVDIGSSTAENAMAVFLQNNDKAVETSVFSAGMLCSGLIGRFRLLLNYQAGRAWFLPPEDDAP